MRKLEKVKLKKNHVKGIVKKGRFKGEWEIKIGDSGLTSAVYHNGKPVEFVQDVTIRIAVGKITRFEIGYYEPAKRVAVKKL